MKLVIAGSRDFNDYGLMKKHLKQFKITEVVSGCASGADRFGERYAMERDIPIKKFPALWDTYGLSAGPIRNKLMAGYADHVIVFWNGVSRGTKSMMDIAMDKHLPLTVILY